MHENPYEDPYEKPQENLYENPYQTPYAEKRVGYKEAKHQPLTLGQIMFSFEGRIPRRIYWAASIGLGIFSYAAIFAIVIIMELMPPLADVPQNAIASGLLMLGGLAGYGVMLWSSLAIQAKRWHDLGKSGAWVLIWFIPLIGPIWTFVEVGCMRGNFGPNQYGPDPT